jgi:hypothetical protein
MPILTTAVTALAMGLAKKGLESAFETTGEKVTEGAITWFTSLFKKDNGESKKILQELEANPDNKDIINKAIAIIENAVEDNPKHEEYLAEIIEKNPNVSIDVAKSKNVSIGNVNTGGGDFRIGDNNG